MLKNLIYFDKMKKKMDSIKCLQELANLHLIIKCIKMSTTCHIIIVSNKPRETLVLFKVTVCFVWILGQCQMMSESEEGSWQTWLNVTKHFNTLPHPSKFSASLRPDSYGSCLTTKPTNPMILLPFTTSSDSALCFCWATSNSKNDMRTCRHPNMFTCWLQTSHLCHTHLPEVDPVVVVVVEGAFQVTCELGLVDVF